jgi:TolB-like protein
MTDEIMTALAKYRDSAWMARRNPPFSSQGERNDMRAVGQALNAQYLLNGSDATAAPANRGADSRQAARASNDGVGLWTDSYDRELTGTFSRVRKVIAQAIAGELLSVPLGVLRQGKQLVSSRTGNLRHISSNISVPRRRSARAAPGEGQIATSKPWLPADPTYDLPWAALGEGLWVFPPANTVFRAPRTPGEEIARAFAFTGLANGGKWPPPRGHSPGTRCTRADIRRSAMSRTVAATSWQREELREKAMALDPGDTENLERHAAMLGRARAISRTRIAHQSKPAGGTGRTLRSGIQQTLVTSNLQLSLGARQTAIRLLEGDSARPTQTSSWGGNVALAAEAKYCRAVMPKPADLLLAAAPAAEGLRSHLSETASTQPSRPRRPTPSIARTVALWSCQWLLSPNVGGLRNRVMGWV